MEMYEKALSHLREKGFESFTALQETAFSKPEVYDYAKDLFVIGETSSGKTMIPLLIYSMAVQQAREQGLPLPKLLFVVPYRALSAQKMEELKDFLGQDNEDMTIVQSTAEFRQDDAAIQKGEVDCAIIITEKAFKYESRTPGFLAKYDYIVLDEVGLLQNADRGVRLDFLFAWSVAQKRVTGRPRLIALGTPFFDWSAYLESYDFVEIREDNRPVDLKKVVITYDNNKRYIRKVEGECSFLSPVRLFSKTKLQSYIQDKPSFGDRCPWLPKETEFCPYGVPCRVDEALNCPHAEAPCIQPIKIEEKGTTSLHENVLLRICREHLQKGHQILIFVNNRNRVMELAAMLYRELSEFFPCELSDEECKRRILDDCGLEDEDVFGILETLGSNIDLGSFYRTFISGVGFHSAALPHELRSYVERHFLDKREMKIVCSTETLAFGINSAVDVVVVADMQKREGAQSRPLMLNEYQNYAGRAGRLRRGKDRSQLIGYVYTLVSQKQEPLWIDMMEEARTPEKLYSLLHGERTDYMPFFLLNILPATESGGVSIDLLTQMAQLLPHDDEIPEKVLNTQIRDAVHYLVSKELLGKPMNRTMGRGARDSGERYCLTEQGKNLRGLIIGEKDFDILTEALVLCVPDLSTEPDRERFLFALLSTRHVKVGSAALDEDSDTPDAAAKTKMTTQEVTDYIRGIIRAHGGNSSWVINLKPKERLVLGAMLAWCEGESPKMLLRSFDVHFSILNRVAERVAYLIEVAQALLTKRIEMLWERGSATIIGTGGVDYFLRAKERREEIFSNWFISAFYGINTDVTGELLEYLEEQEEEAAHTLAEELSLHHVNPTTARLLRRLVIRYRFFENPPYPETDDIELRNNFKDQYTRYVGDVKENLGHTGTGAAYIHKFFQMKFPKDFS